GVDATDTTVTVSTATPGVTFADGSTTTTVPVGGLGSFNTLSVPIDVRLASTVTDAELLNLAIVVNSPSACVPSLTTTFAEHINVDDAPASSTIDTVEPRTTSWTRTGTDGNSAWVRTLPGADTQATTGPGDHAWNGIDLSTAADNRLESPDLVVSATDPLVLTFDHRFSFETQVNPAPPNTFFDGGVIEVSTDGGMSWTDINTIVDPGYTGTLDATAGNANPIRGRMAFVGRNASFPSRDTVTLNLATMLAGQTIRIRFRVGSDVGGGDLGWEIDNIALTGITNTPFVSLIPDRRQCHAVCEVGLSTCGLDCTDLQTDPRHCGDCAIACNPGEVCSN